jgi:hypothetical protein
MRKSLVAVGARAESDPAVLWKIDEATPDSSTPVASDKHVYWVADNGIATSVELATGRVAWRERLPARGDYKASPILAAGNLYFLNTQGVCTVVPTEGPFRVLATNTLPDETLASPAVSRGRIYLRGAKAVYAIGP